MKQPPSYETQELREFVEVLRGRRTISLFLQTKVPEKLVLEAIESATWAPNHHVTEPWHFYRLGDATKERCLDLCHTIALERKGGDAADFKRQNWSEKPGWLVVTCRRCDDVLLHQENYAACSAAVQNFMLHLWKAGVGSKWTSGDITRDGRFFEVVGIDASTEFVVGLIWFGYPKLTPGQTRQDVAAVVSTLS